MTEQSMFDKKLRDFDPEIWSLAREEELGELHRAYHTLQYKSILARRNKGRLVIPRYMDITIPQTVFTIPQNMLPVPPDRLLEQIKTRFQNKLEYYNIETAVY